MLMPKPIPEEFEDTSPEALAVWMDLHRKMPIGDKLLAVFSANEFLDQVTRAGVKLQYPNASEREVFLRAAARRLGRDLMIRVYGWDPEGDAQPE